VWKAAQDKRWSRDLLDAALSGAVEPPKIKPEESKDPVAFLIEYRDGRRGTVLMLGGVTRDFLAAVKVAGQAAPLAANFWLQPGAPYGHFTMLVRGIDRMFATGKPSWPVERTLLTTGVLDAALTSKLEKNRRLP